MAVLLVEPLFRRGDEVVVKFVLHQVDRTAAETAAHDARTRHTARLGNFGQEVQFLARHFVILRHAPVGFVHPLADRFVVTLFERIADIEHTLLLADHVAGTLVVLLRNLILDGIELLHRGAAQELLPEHLRHPLARSPAVVVGRTHQLVLHARIEQDEFVTLGVEREIGILQRTAVQTDQVALLAENRSELIHDAAVHAAIVMLGGLADLRQFEFVDAQRIEVVQRKGIGRLQRCRRRHAGTQRHVAREYRIETADLTAPLLNLAAYAEDIASPALGGFIGFVQPELRAFTQVERIGPHLVRAVEFDGRHDSFVNRPRENEAPVVIGMFPDQVDTPRRGEQDSPGAVNLLELFADFFFHGLFWF